MPPTLDFSPSCTRQTTQKTHPSRPVDASVAAIRQQIAQLACHVQVRLGSVHWCMRGQAGDTREDHANRPSERKKKETRHPHGVCGRYESCGRGRYSSSSSRYSPNGDRVSTSNQSMLPASCARAVRRRDKLVNYMNSWHCYSRPLVAVYNQGATER